MDVSDFHGAEHIQVGLLMKALCMSARHHSRFIARHNFMSAQTMADDNRSGPVLPKVPTGNTALAGSFAFGHFSRRARNGPFP